MNAPKVGSVHVATLKEIDQGRMLTLHLPKGGHFLGTGRIMDWVGVSEWL
jgi:hypothetical protein